jgi:hypothetical protein
LINYKKAKNGTERHFLDGDSTYSNLCKICTCLSITFYASQMTNK